MSASIRDSGPSFDREPILRVPNIFPDAPKLRKPARPSITNSRNSGPALICIFANSAAFFSPHGMRTTLNIVQRLSLHFLQYNLSLRLQTATADCELDSRLLHFVHLTLCSIPAVDDTSVKVLDNDHIHGHAVSCKPQMPSL